MLKVDAARLESLRQRAVKARATPVCTDYSILVYR